LWQESRTLIAQEVLQAGFEAYVVCTDSRYLADEFCGRRYDAQFLAELPPGVDACGENGEFHTFVFNGPMFQQPVPCRVVAFEDYTAPASLGGVRYRFAKLA
jgi:diphthamide synthase (EF-2-diphthine--ammonia ligase)